MWPLFSNRRGGIDCRWQGEKIVAAGPAGQPYLEKVHIQVFGGGEKMSLLTELRKSLSGWCYKDGAPTVLEQGRLRDVSIMRSCATSGARGLLVTFPVGAFAGANFRTGYRHSLLRGGEGGNLALLANGVNRGGRPSGPALP